MEKHYQKNPGEEILVDAKPNIDYKKELSLEEKKNILKDIYFSIDLFDKLLYETKQKSFKRE